MVGNCDPFNQAIWNQCKKGSRKQQGSSLVQLGHTFCCSFQCRRNRSMLASMTPYFSALECLYPLFHVGCTFLMYSNLSKMAKARDDAKSTQYSAFRQSSVCLAKVILSNNSWRHPSYQHSPPLNFRRHFFALATCSLCPSQHLVALAHVILEYLNAHCSNDGRARHRQLLPWLVISSVCACALQAA